MNEHSMKLLVGDNPFHGISHLSQQRVRTRSIGLTSEDTEYAARLVKLSLENGANGFMFSVAEATLSILKTLGEDNTVKEMSLYPIVPYAYEYVRRATRTGGVSGLAKNLGKEMVFSSNIKVILPNIIGLIQFNPSSLLKVYVAYELTRIKKTIKDNSCLKSIQLHEIITDMALALNLKQTFKEYIKFVEKSGVRPGFETRNFATLVKKFSEWDIDFSKITITSSFNKVGFQMDPSKEECEKALVQAHDAEVIAMSILAAGYLSPLDAVTYIKQLNGISGVVVGVSKEAHAINTFNLLEQNLTK
jgi:hypothetical protein